MKIEMGHDSYGQAMGVSFNIASLKALLEFLLIVFH